MNTKKICALAVASCLCTAGASAAPLDFYVGVTGGIGGQSYFADSDNTSKSAVSYGAMFGIDVPFVRAELEYNRLDTKLFETNAAMANIYFKLPMPMITPYAGLGAGMSFSGKIKDSSIDADNSWAAQGMLGVSFGIPATGMFVDLEGRAMYLPQIFKADDTDALHYDLRAKVRYQF